MIVLSLYAGASHGHLGRSGCRVRAIGRLS
jgi:hypothetical protein